MNRPRTKSNGVQFGAENTGFQSFMEDEINLKNRNHELNFEGNYLQQPTPEILTNDRHKHYSQANYYNANQQQQQQQQYQQQQYHSTKSSYQSPGRKLAGNAPMQAPLQNNNQDVLTIKRDSVKFLNEREFTTAPNLKEVHT